MSTHHIGQRCLTALVLVAVPTYNALAQTWTQTSAPLTNWSCVASSADGSRLVAAVDGGLVYVSTNSGATWHSTSAPTNAWTCVASSADGRKLVAGTHGLGASGKTYTSADAGETWVTNNSPFGITSLASSADGTRVAATCAGCAGVRFSTNAGATWRALTAYVSRSTPIFSSATISADGTKVAASWGTVTTERGIVIWSGLGQSNESSRVVPLGLGLGHVLACSADALRLLSVFISPRRLDCTSALFTSSDSGATWTTFCTLVEDWSSVASSADGTRLVAVAASGAIYTSTNTGATWTPTAAPSGNWVSIASSADGGRLVAAMGGGGIYTSQITPAPVLNLRLAGTNVVASWIVPSMEFALQENEELTSTNWTDVAAVPSLNYTTLQYEVTMQKEAATRFYRLALVNPGGS